MRITLEIISDIVNTYSEDKVTVKHRTGDHPFYRGLYLFMGRKYGGTSDNKVAKFIDMDHTMVNYWVNNLEGWFFTRKDLKWVFDSVDREIRHKMEMLSGVEVLDYQAQEVLNRMTA